MIGFVFYFYNILQEFVHQHFSKRRNKNIIFQISKRYSKRSFYHGINGLNAKQSSHEIPRGFFSTNPWNRYGNKFSTHISQYIHGFARRVIYYMQK